MPIHCVTPIAHAKNSIEMKVILSIQGSDNMKILILKIANDFHKDTMQHPKENYSSYALFYAQFQVDRNLNIFAIDTYHSHCQREAYSEIISLRDDLYGSSLKVLKYFDDTRNKSAGKESRLDAEILGDYEWLIRQDESWNFRFDWKYLVQGKGMSRMRANETFYAKRVVVVLLAIFKIISLIR